jgi:Cytochrome P460
MQRSDGSLQRVVSRWRGWGGDTSVMLILPKMFLLLAMFSSICFGVQIDNPYDRAPEFTADGQMKMPENYRRWVYLSTGMDMSYAPGAGAPDHHMFDNVFVNPEAYEAFVETGKWPEKTTFVLEVRGAEQKGSINQRGHFQGGLMGVEVHVKDTKRFEGGWAFFGFDDMVKTAKMTPKTADCYSCHQSHGAVDTTFVQFYPTLLPIAKSKMTLSAEYKKEQVE